MSNPTMPGKWILACVLACATAAAAQEERGALAGTWESRDFGCEMVLTLKADGTGTIDGAAIRWNAGNGALVVVEDGERIEYRYAREGNRMRVSGGDLEGEMTFVRRGATGLGGRQNRTAKVSGGIGVGDGEAGASAQSALDGNRTEGGCDPQAALVPANRTARDVSVDRAPANAVNLVGVWASATAVVEVRPDGMLATQGGLFHLSVRGNVLHIQGSDGSIALPFRLSHDVLEISANGQVEAYRRLSAEEVATLQEQWALAAAAQAMEQEQGTQSGGSSGSDAWSDVNPDDARYGLVQNTCWNLAQKSVNGR